MAVVSMSRHLLECAGDDYCAGDCRYDGIPQPAILERAKDVTCRCDWAKLHHSPDCPDSPEFEALVRNMQFWPHTLDFPIRIHETWYCVKHGPLGDINGPVHYELCRSEEA